MYVQAHNNRKSAPAGRFFVKKRRFLSKVCTVQAPDNRKCMFRPLITGSEAHTAFIKNSIRFSHFGDTFHRNNMPDGENTTEIKIFYFYFDYCFIFIYQWIFFVILGSLLSLKIKLLAPKN